MAENRHIAGKEKTAVAVAYNPGEVAPKILAVGKGEVAERIIETAKENDVPFYQDNKLAETLSRLQIGDTIPPELYEVDPCLCGRYGPHEGKTQRIRLTVGR